MASDLLNPFKADALGREQLKEVLLDIRDQSGCRNWEDFCALARHEAGLELPESTLETYGPTPRYANLPNPGLFYALEAWSKVRKKPFTFSNGDPISAMALMDVVYGLRDSSGNA